MNLIDLNDVIDMISTLYRGERKGLADMRNEQMALQKELQEAINTEWKHISVARRTKFIAYLTNLRWIWKLVDDVRKVFMTFGRCL